MTRSFIEEQQQSLAFLGTRQVGVALFVFEQRRHLPESGFTNNTLIGFFAGVNATVLPEGLRRAQRLAAHLAKVPGQAQMHLGEVRAHQPLIIEPFLAQVALEATRVLVRMCGVRAQHTHRGKRLAACVTLVGAVARLRVRRRVLGETARLDALAANAAWRRPVAMNLTPVLA